MRSITFKNKDNEQLTLKIHSSTTGDGLLESGSVVINHDNIGYFTDIVGSSSLEFTLIAESNGQYRDLYTTSVTGIKVELMKGASVIYSGYLDSEIYEEDYNTLTKYPINFKCGNTKILKRLDFALSGNKTVKEVLTHCTSKIGLSLNYSSVLKSGVINSGDFIINTSIFYKDGEPMNCWDVTENVLQSLNLRSLVIGNVFYVFDIASIAARGTLNNQSYLLGNATLSAAECYKEVIINLDTASDKQIFDLKIDKFEFPYPANSNITIKEKQGDGDSDTGFIQQITTKKTFDNITLISGCSVVRNSPRFSGSDEIYIKSDTITPTSTASVLWKSRQISVNAIQSKDWFLNIKLDALLSIRSNPFRGVKEKEDTNPRSGWWSNHENDFQNRTNYTYITGDVYLYNESGQITHYLKNSNSSREATPATWIAGSPTTKGNFLFAYYDNMANNSGFDGWQTNSPTIPSQGNGYSYGNLTKTMKRKGTLAQLPPTAGSIEVVIYKGVGCIDGANGGTVTQDYSDFRHLWYKDLKVSICDANGHDNYSMQDYEYKAILDNNADNKLQIDNIIGQIVDEDYSCRAGFLNSSGKFLTSFQYGQYNDRLEVVNLNVINDVYKQPRNVFQTKLKPFGLANIAFVIADLNKSFWCCGFEYDVEKNTYEMTLNEVV